MPRLLALLLVANTALARDLGNRLGVGFRAGTGAPPVLSVRYGLPTGNPAINVQLEAMGGLDLGDLATDNVLVGGRLLYAVVVEDNMNLYAIGGGSLLSQDGSNGLRLEPALGAEYFPFGVENLGVNGEVGLRMDLGDALGVGTTAAFGLTYWV